MNKKTSKEYLETALGGNMYIATLKLKFWHEIMDDYAKYYSKDLITSAVEERTNEIDSAILDIEAKTIEQNKFQQKCFKAIKAIRNK